jgi:hypothetical protein
VDVEMYTLSEDAAGSTGTDRGLAEYKRFIDGLVEQAKPGSVTGRQLLEGDDPYPKLLWDKQTIKYNAMAQGLTSEHRELIAHLLDEERVSAIHDVLSFLTWKEYRILSRDSIELDFEPFGTENFYDFICRLDGDSWPDEHDTPTEENQ